MIDEKHVSAANDVNWNDVTLDEAKKVGLSFSIEAEAHDEVQKHSARLGFYLGNLLSFSILVLIIPKLGISTLEMMVWIYLGTQVGSTIGNAFLLYLARRMLSQLQDDTFQQIKNVADKHPLR